MARPSANVNIFSENPQVVETPTIEIKTHGYQNNQILKASEFNHFLSEYQKWVKYLDEQRAAGVTADTGLSARTKSLEDSRTNRLGEIIITTSTTPPPDCLACNGQALRKVDHQDFVNYALSHGYFETDTLRYDQAIAYQRWGKLMHYSNDPNNNLFYVPKLEDVFLRMEGASHLNVGTYQGDEFKSHNHFVANSNRTSLIGGTSGNQVSVNITGASNGYLSVEGLVTSFEQYNYAFLFNNSQPNVLRSSNTGGQETRPMNIAVRFWIRWR